MLIAINKLNIGDKYVKHQRYIYKRKNYKF